jgi:hypothetical protein
MKKTVYVSLIILMLGLSVFPVKPVEAQQSTGSISFQPSEIPNIGFDYNVQEYQFELTWKQFYLNIKPFAIYNGQRLEFDQIIPWIKNNYPNVDYRWAVQKFKNYHRWGYWLEKLPQDVADNLDYLGFDVSDTNIPLNTVEIEEVQSDNFTFKRIHIAERFTLDFYELYERGFEVSINKTMILIGKVKGKTDLDLDPITYGAPLITVVGFTEGTPCTFWDLWNASNVNGWNVVNNTCNTQYKFWAHIVIGNGWTDTWFGDEEKQIVFADGISSVHWENKILVKTDGTFRVGVLMDSINKIGGRGCAIQLLETTYYSYLIKSQNGFVQLYGSTFVAPYRNYNYIQILNLDPVYDCIFDRTLKFYYSNGDFERVTMIEPFNGGLVVSEGTFNDFLISNATNYAIFNQAANNITISNLINRNSPNFIQITSTTTGQVYLIDTVSDTWGIIWAGLPNNGTLWRQNTLNLNVVDQDGEPLEDVEVLITYSGQGSLEEVYFGLTPGNGAIPEQTITKGFYNETGGNTLYPFEPYTVSMRRAGYLTNIFLFNFSNPVNWTIPLMPDPYAGRGGELIAVLILIPMIGVIIWGVKRR